MESNDRKAPSMNDLQQQGFQSSAPTDSSINCTTPKGNTLAEQRQSPAPTLRADGAVIGGAAPWPREAKELIHRMESDRRMNIPAQQPQQDEDAKLPDRIRALQAGSKWSAQVGLQQRPEGPVMCEVRAQHAEISGLLAALDALEARLAPALMSRPVAVEGAAIGGDAPHHPTRMLQDMAAVTARLARLTARINGLADALVL